MTKSGTQAGPGRKILHRDEGKWEGNKDIAMGVFPGGSEDCCSLDTSGSELQDDSNDQRRRWMKSEHQGCW